jgi:hypothetical protein
MLNYRYMVFKLVSGGELKVAGVEVVQEQSFAFACLAL